ncbi:MAG: outer membrane protein assembly factor BamD [Deltaproteobacteria bacterium]|nr:outer membrane protein assembly factor BamD [Deltaproteobacteria bacterium]
MKWLVPLLLLLLSACSLLEKKQTYFSPEEHFQRGEQQMEKGNYREAIENWQKVLDAYLSPQLNMLAELKIAEAHFKAKEYPEATATYENFLKRHPEARRTPEVMYKLGLCYFHQRLTPDRDQTATFNALVTFQSLIRMFPDDPQAANAAAKVAELRQELAEHEFYVGRFYLRTKEYPAAIGRFQALFAEFPDFGRKDEAYFLLGQAYFHSANLPKTVETFQQLAKEFPQSPFVAKSRKLLPDS